jgi:uncharacterized membrane protein
MQKQQIIQILDAAIVTWPQGRNRPKTYQAFNTAGAGALGGAFWGMLFGLIFFVPLFGMLVGATAGAISGSFTDYGIDDSFINDLKTKVTEGTSAQFTPEERGELIQSNLNADQEAKLRHDFGAEV